MNLPRWDRVEAFVDRSEFWKEFIHREELKSTNRFLRNYGELEPGLVVLAERQSSGRGKGAHRWHSPEGGLWVSFSLGGLSPGTVPDFYVKVLELIRDLLSDYGVETSVSRPNDLVVEGKKIAGMLVEECDDYYILGLGINVNNEVSGMPRAVRENSTSMKEEAGERIERPELLTNILSGFETFSGPGKS